MLKRLFAAVFAVAAVASAHAAIPTRPQIDVLGYVIHADLDPSTGKLNAMAVVTFTVREDVNVAVFGLNNALQIVSISDGANPSLAYERNVSDSTVRVTPTAILTKGSTATWTFTYAGAPTVDTSPVDGIKFVQVADPVSVLLYAGRWFPIALPGLFTDRFTAEMHITVPKDETVIGSGGGTKKDEHEIAGGRKQFDFKWNKAGFPGSIVAGKFLPAITAPGIPNVRVYVTEGNREKAHDLALNTVKAFEFMTDKFGGAESGRLEVVELPSDSVSAAWAPEMVAIKPDRGNPRLIANTVAHQWWGSEVSPATLNDAWITNGMCRYAELMYVEDQNGKTNFQNAILDAEAEGLAYDTEPLTTLGRIDPFSPEFQSMTFGKGAMVFHMLRWEMGDVVFTKFLQSLLTQYADKSVRTSNVQSVAEDQSKLQLTAFFSQWLDGTGAPEFTDNYSVFRLGKGKGFRTVGSVSQDLDLFSMPVELKIETEGKTEQRRVDLSGTESRYTVETFGRPRRITIDPDNWLLKSTPDLAVRVAVLRGQQDVAQGDLIGAIGEYQKALASNRGSSLANYRLAEIFFMQKNYQSSANSFRDALRGDNDPKWTEVWSHVNLGKIFDVTGQRERAVNEYRQAIQTNDNTQGAINEARALMQKPFKREQDEGN